MTKILTDFQNFATKFFIHMELKHLKKYTASYKKKLNLIFFSSEFKLISPFQKNIIFFFIQNRWFRWVVNFFDFFQFSGAMTNFIIMMSRQPMHKICALIKNPYHLKTSNGIQASKRNSELINSLLTIPKTINDAGK